MVADLGLGQGGQEDEQSSMGRRDGEVMTSMHCVRMGRRRWAKARVWTVGTHLWTHDDEDDGGGEDSCSPILHPHVVGNLASFNASTRTSGARRAPYNDLRKTIFE